MTTKEIYDLIRLQHKTSNVELEKIYLIEVVCKYLINDVLKNAVFMSSGSILKYYGINVTLYDLKPLKRKFTKQDILFGIADLIQNNSGIEKNLLHLLKMIITYDSNN